MSNTWPVARDGQLDNDISAILISLVADNERNKMPLPRISARIPMTVLAQPFRQASTLTSVTADRQQEPVNPDVLASP